MQTKWVRQGGAIVPEEYLRETAAHEAEVELMVALKDELESHNRDLKRIDDRLEIVWAPESVTNPALTPGRYHLIRRNDPPAPPGIWPLETKDGSFKEPGAWMYDWVLSLDMWNERVMADREKARQEAETARNKRRREEREELAWEIDTRLKAKTNPGILFGDNRWSYRAGARRAR